MEHIFYFTPADLIAACAAIVTVSGAVGYLIKAVAAVRKPNADQNKRLDDIEEKIAEHDRRFRTDNERLKAIEEGNRVSQRALLALLDHGLDGNNLEQMHRAKNDLQNHLIER